MHTIKINVHDSIYKKLMGLLEILPKDKVEILEDNDYPSISFDDAKAKVERAVNNISENEGIPLDSAIDIVKRS